METDQLILENMYFADQIAYLKKKSLKFLSIDEIKSAAYFGLVQAARNYPGEGNFQKFASFRINGAIIDYAREIAWGKRGHYVQTCECKDHHLGEDISLSSEIFDLAEEYLSEFEFNILNLYYIDGLTMGEIGVRLNLSLSRISQICKEIIIRLRKVWDKEIWSEVA